MCPHKIMNNTFWIGVYPGLTHQELDFVTDQIKGFVHNFMRAHRIK